MKTGGPRVILLDFDGVVLESADIKTDAFRALFAREPRHVSAAVAYHRRHAGVSRFKKFDHIYKNILRRPLPAVEKRWLGAEFSRLVFKKVLACPWVPGARRFLKAAARQRTLVVISGTPQSELRDIVRRRGLASLFKGVYGAPRTKEALAEWVLKRWRCRPSEALFVGDARTDWQAARRWKIPFLGRVPRGSRNPFPPDTDTVRDLRGLAARVNKEP